jgi:hypothetical protein
MMSPPVGTDPNFTGAPMSPPNPPVSGGVVSSPRSFHFIVHMARSA